MLQNFEKNGLVNTEDYVEFCDKFNESSSIPDISARNLGGCVLLDATFSLGKYFLTVLWFRNPTFLFRSNYIYTFFKFKFYNFFLEEAVIHPVGMLVSSKIQHDDYEYLLSELQSKLNTKDKIAR